MHKATSPPELLQKSCRNIFVRGSWMAHQHGARTCSYNRSSFTEVLLHALVAKFHFQKLHSPNFPYQCLSSFFCNISVPVAFLLNTAMNLLSEIKRPKCFYCCTYSTGRGAFESQGSGAAKQLRSSSLPRPGLVCPCSSDCSCILQRLFKKKAFS